LAISTAEQVADLLAVISWAEVFLAEELESMVSGALRVNSSTVSRLESLLVTLRPVEAARLELARLDGDLLLGGAGLRATRLRCGSRRFLAAPLDRP
jgi:hypothetical protein